MYLELQSHLRKSEVVHSFTRQCPLFTKEVVEEEEEEEEEEEDTINLRNENLN